MTITYMDQKVQLLIASKAYGCNAVAAGTFIQDLKVPVEYNLRVVLLSDQVFNMQRGISWSMLYHRLPGASVLAVDLLENMYRASNTIDSQIDVIPRAEVIQNLAIFISNLQKIINRREVNQEACKWAHEILSGILGEVIDPQSREAISTDTVQSRIAASIPFSDTFGLDNDLVTFDDPLRSDWKWGSNP
ncbi:uncharacterized protein ACLA_086980 [Aspergillus clavatus NRRL 1]|uniref:Uncharacterized protein n=1 Tax=Aspergillus clavatus (strain ATCC 1007 / CBS 513.65 / DSM 816 / NCTC 3887 / NRRL 1 / QM 1276 / 107) TaxID=344612 RepID=A1CUK8_ASPCL|nr:uncharacterized protein ACLA_086980 [Aspergillus clavatus NRRL 1]EAW06995.1 hypothetical protein ACLA_086980 [Aspergillus clavatus NRRL 1]